MKIDIPQKLYDLIKFVPRLYVVGGFVRNSLMGIETSDIDVCGEYLLDELQQLLAKSPYQISLINKRLGTLKISDESGFFAEYTTFRQDNYPDDGSHRPAKVLFNKSIEQDCLRRDFTINAIYADVSTGEVFDFVGGLDDLKNKVIKTPRSAEQVFREDGLRLLRLVRFSAELGFQIAPEVLLEAKSQCFRLKDISPDRIRDEFLKIIKADCRYPELANVDAHFNAIKLLDELGLLEIIIPELSQAKGLAQDKRYHIHDVFWHILYTYKACPPELRLAGLMHDIGKPLSAKLYGNMYEHARLGAEIAQKRLGSQGLRLPNRDVDKIKRLILAHMYDMDGKTSIKKLRGFIAKNRDILEDIINLKLADAYGSCGKFVTPVAVERLREQYGLMQKEKVPFSVKKLLVGGADLIALEIPVQKRADTLNRLLELAICDKSYRSRAAQLKFLEEVKNGNR